MSLGPIILSPAKRQKKLTRCQSKCIKQGSVERVVFWRLASGFGRDLSWPFLCAEEKPPVYLLYVDESDDPGVNGSPYLVLGAAALFEGKWSPLEKEIRGLIDRYFPNPPRPTEIHLAELRKGKNEFRNLTPIQRNQLLADFCGIASSLLATELNLFSVVADKAWWFAQNPGKAGDDLYAALFEDLTSRFDLFLRRRYAENAPTKGIIIADPHKDALCEALKRKHVVYQRQGHKWDQIHNVIETVFFLESHDSPGLQLADLTSYCLWRLVTAHDDLIAKMIQPLFDRESLTSRINPGKWHGIKYLGNDAATRARITAVWP
jgi:hypothetical protein